MMDIASLRLASASAAAWLGLEKRGLGNAFLLGKRWPQCSGRVEKFELELELDFS